MNTIEIIGWIATIGTLLSFAVKDMYKLRLINAAASMVWIVYGILKADNPIIVRTTARPSSRFVWQKAWRQPGMRSWHWRPRRRALQNAAIWAASACRRCQPCTSDTTSTSPPSMTARSTPHWPSFVPISCISRITFS